MINNSIKLRPLRSLFGGVIAKKYLLEYNIKERGIKKFPNLYSKGKFIKFYLYSFKNNFEFFNFINII